jgi:hypothetical protein
VEEGDFCGQKPVLFTLRFLKIENPSFKVFFAFLDLQKHASTFFWFLEKEKREN